jgi:hypothetical protein
LKNDVNVPSKSNKLKKFGSGLVRDMDPRIQSGSGSTPKWHGSTTLLFTIAKKPNNYLKYFDYISDLVSFRSALEETYIIPDTISMTIG